MFTFTYTLSVVLLITMPLIFALILRRKFKVSWLLFVVGALTFSLSQVVHIPLNNLLEKIGLLSSTTAFDSVPLWQASLILGFTAGLCEEVFRALGYLVLKKARRFEDGFMLGLGHGGIEAMVIGGVMLAATVSSLTALQGTDLSSLNLSANQLAILEKQLLIFEQSPLLAFVPLGERLLAMTAHMIFSFIVLEAFRKKNGWYVVFAIVFHTIFDFVAIYVGNIATADWQPYAAFILMDLIGVTWLVLTWRKKVQFTNHRPLPVKREMGMFFTALRKELFQQWRSKRFLVTMIIFVLFGLMAPMSTYFMPDIIKSAAGGEQFAALIPEMGVQDVFLSYHKNLTQMGFLLVIFLGMGAVAAEKDKGITAMILSKPLPRTAFVMSKFAAQALIYLAGFIIMAASSYYYTVLLFGEMDFSAFIQVNGLLYLWVLVYAAITLLGSTIGNSTGSAAGIAIGGSVAMMLAGSFPKIGMFTPSGLAAWASALGTADATGIANSGIIAINVVLIIILCLASIGSFENQEL